jgi:hypothetical protein
METPWMGKASNLSTSSMDELFLVRFGTFPLPPSARGKFSDCSLKVPDTGLNQPDSNLNATEEL